MCENTSIFPLYIHVVLKKKINAKQGNKKVISPGQPFSDDNEQVCDSSFIFGLHSIF